MNNVYLSVIVPAYNEECNIENTLKKISNYLETKNFISEIIVVDDGSNDATVQRAKEVKETLKTPLIILEEKPNRGKGYALKCGFMVAKGKFILFTDADLSTPIEEFDKMLPYLEEGYDIVMASRHLPESKIMVRQSVWREILGNIFYKIVFIFLVKGISDTNCGFKSYRGAVAKQLYSHLTIYRWGFDTEIIYLAQKYGFKIKEVPVMWFNNPNSKVSILSAVFNTLRELIKIKFNDWRGRY
jgi:dolichyl-phosphate beta-glucosyltransferase